MSVATLLKKSSIFATGATVVALGLMVTAPAQASTFTRTSPTEGGELSAANTEVGGIVLDLIGANDTRVTSQTAASSLFQGFFNSNPGIIGTQTGFDSSLISQLGGGLKEVGLRLTVFDGDTAAGNFDFNNQNFLLANGINFGDFSAVNTQQTDAQGNAGPAGFSGGGFRNNILDTGWFHVTDAGVLGSFYNSLVSLGQVTYALDDVDPRDNFFDFTQGIDPDQATVGQGPTVVPSNPPAQSVPEPASILGLMTVGALSAGSALKRKKKQAA